MVSFAFSNGRGRHWKSSFVLSTIFLCEAAPVRAKTLLEDHPGRVQPLAPRSRLEHIFAGGRKKTIKRDVQPSPTRRELNRKDQSLASAFTSLDGRFVPCHSKELRNEASLNGKELARLCGVAVCQPICDACLALQHA